MDPIPYILTVCTGNICRSPMAEYLLRQQLGPDSEGRVSSAGVYATNGQPASEEAVRALAERGIDASAHRSRMLTRPMAEEADYILVMTRSHQDAICSQWPDLAAKVRGITAFRVARDQERDIPDPIGQSTDVYRQTCEQLNAALADFILYLADQGDIETRDLGKDIQMKIAIGADHGGFEVKEAVKTHLLDKGIVVEDLGCHNTDSVDYPDYASDVARLVSGGDVDRGILICTSGIGMCIMANRFPRVRAGLCTTPRMAKMARTHNNVNLLTLGGSLVSNEEAIAITDEWLESEYEGGRHDRRLNKIRQYSATIDDPVVLYENDPEIYSALRSESRRLRENIELIASENYASRAVREAQGSVMTNKYAEGYPGKRWYHGCEFVDQAERLAIERARELFGAEHANVQPHSGSSANMAVYFGVLDPGDTILAMSLAHGGHLTHGHKVNFSGRFFNVVQYGVDQQTELIDYDEVEALADKHKPKLICCGASAYSRIIDFKRLRKIADGVGAYLMADMAHIAGLVAGGCHPNPVPYCEFVTTTTHKTLRGPRGGLILCQERFAPDIDRQIFPGIQGGPLMHVIAAKAVCFHEALQPAFKTYAQQVVSNAQTLAASLEQAGVRIVSGGTDNHLMLVDLTSLEVSGKDAASALDQARITVNKNAIPFDTRSPFVTSGVRLGTPAVTTRGMEEEEMKSIAGFISEVLAHPDEKKVVQRVRDEVIAFTARFPVP